MSNEPTIEQMNIALAAFEGRKFFGHTIDRFGGNTGNTLPEMKYRTSWDWLMPVVEKINHTIIPNNKYPAGVIIFKTTCHINDDMNILIETTITRNGTLIECVHDAVYQFITWYNQQNQNNE